MQIRCPQCLVAFESEEDFSWSDLSCPSCGAGFSLSGEETTESYRPGFEVLGRFVLLEMVGAGRFGSVWKAHDTQLQRNVAVKIPRQRELDPHETELFLRDARAAAQLKHPRIASVHEVGRQNETVYIVTDFIDGANLHEWLTCRRLTAQEAAELMIKIAEAVHHAHESGVVHRDLKPSNIMMDAKGDPHVIDFGLARREIGEMTLTMEGQVLGTPAYMSPEQARGQGHSADGRSDIYSLGVILFKLLTGELPFRGQTRMLILQILEHEPPSPRQLDATVPRDLATITLKCLEKAPEKRYQTAGELASDLKRYLAGEPIKARPVGPVERAWRWCKRRPEVASLSAALLLTLLAISIFAPIVAVQRERLRREAELQLAHKAHNLFQRACEAYDVGREMQGIALLSGAYELAADAKNPLKDSIRSLLSGWDRHGWRPIVTDDAVVAVALSPDGNTALTAGHNSNRVARLWDVRDVPTMKPVQLQHEQSIRAVAFSRDGIEALTASADGIARLWDAQTGQLLRTFQHTKPHPYAVAAVAFSPDGSSIATGGMTGAKLWDAKTGDQLGERLPPETMVYAVAFSPDSRTLLTGGQDSTVRIWDVQSQQQIKSPILADNRVYAVAFTTDGRRIVTGNAVGMLQLWDGDTLQPIGAPLLHAESMHADPEEIYAVAVSPNGHSVLSGSFDLTARIWDIHERGLQPVGVPLRHGGWVMSVAFGPKGHTALTGSADRTARLWDLHEGTILPHEGFVYAAEFSPNGRTVLTAGKDNSARLWDSQSGEARGAPMPHQSAVLAVAFSPDGRTALTASADKKVQFWDAQSGNLIAGRHPWQLGDTAQRIEFTADGKTAIIKCANQVVELWSLAAGRQLASSPLRLEPSEAVIAISPDGRTLLVRGSDEKTVWLWDVETGRDGAKPLPHEDLQRRLGWSMSAAFSDDCRMVVTGAYDQKIRLWEAETGNAIGAFSHDGVVNDVAFGSDGRTILSGSDDKTARLWDAQAQVALGQPLQHTKRVRRVALSPDGGDRCRLALTICGDGSARLWDVSSGKLLARPLQYEVAIDEGMFNADGSVILFKCKDGTARIYDVPQPRRGDPKMIRAWARARTGFLLDDLGALRQLSQAEWLKAQSDWARAQNDANALEKAQ